MGAAFCEMPAMIFWNMGLGVVLAVEKHNVSTL
jgi:hypothetical protein